MSNTITTSQEVLGTKIKEILETDFRFNKVNNVYTYQICPDYCDRLSYDNAIEILKSEDPDEAFRDYISEMYNDYIIHLEKELTNTVWSTLSESEFKSDYNDVQDTLMDLIRCELPYKHFLNQTFCTDIMVDTGDGNYDYTLNSVYPAYAGYYGDTIDNKASIVWLTKQQGYTKTQLNKCLRDEDIDKSKDYLKSLRTELVNSASHMNILTILSEMTLENLITLNKLIKQQDRDGIKYDATNRPYCGYIIIDKSATVGLYDPWNGGGSLFEIELEKDVRLPIRFIRSALPDGGDGYSLNSVYNMRGSYWRDVVKTIKAPKKFPKEVR